jgi:hypothetical protein
MFQVAAWVLTVNWLDLERSWRNYPKEILVGPPDLRGPGKGRCGNGAPAESRDR